MDTIQKLGKSLIQHGPHSLRVYLMKVADDDMPHLLDRVDGLAVEKAYTKLFAKVPARHRDAFLNHGYADEAKVPGFFNGVEDGYFMARFLDEERSRLAADSLNVRNLELARQKWGAGLAADAVLEGELVKLNPNQADEMSALYGEVFRTYPFPIHDPEYLRRTMAENIHYYGVRLEGRLVALASAETDPAAGNVEMTDFATSPAALGRGYAAFLLQRMEKDMGELGFSTTYTIARSESAGMNITFAKFSYAHAGTLVNNTNISGNIESMNVWYRPL